MDVDYRMIHSPQFLWLFIRCQKSNLKRSDWSQYFMRRRVFNQSNNLILAEPFLKAGCRISDHPQPSDFYFIFVVAAWVFVRYPKTKLKLSDWPKSRKSSFFNDEEQKKRILVCSFKIGGVSSEEDPSWLSKTSTPPACARTRERDRQRMNPRNASETRELCCVSDEQPTSPLVVF